MKMYLSAMCFVAIMSAQALVWAQQDADELYTGIRQNELFRALGVRAGTRSFGTTFVSYEDFTKVRADAVGYPSFRLGVYESRQEALEIYQFGTRTASMPGREFSHRSGATYTVFTGHRNFASGNVQLLKDNAVLLFGYRFNGIETPEAGRERVFAFMNRMIGLLSNNEEIAPRGTIRDSKQFGFRLQHVPEQTSPDSRIRHRSLKASKLRVSRNGLDAPDMHVQALIEGGRPGRRLQRNPDGSYAVKIPVGSESVSMAVTIMDEQNFIRRIDVVLEQPSAP